MYHLRSNYKNRLEFPFNYFSCLKCGGGGDDDDDDYDDSNGDITSIISYMIIIRFIYMQHLVLCFDN